MRVPSLLAAAALAAALLVPPAAAQDDPWTLKMNPMKKGLDGWTRTGSEKAFLWSAEDATLTLKGQSGKEPPALMYPGVVWDRGELRAQVKRGARKVRFRLQPVPEGKPLALELPGSALKGGNWTDAAVRLAAGRASVVAWGADGAEAEVASVATPEGARFRMGFEAPSGVDAVLSNVRFQRTYVEEPPFAEEGFRSTFDGTSMGAWTPGRPEFASAFRVEKGLLIAEVRTEDVGWLVLTDRRYKEYELRMRALWGSNALEIRAYEAPGTGGQINRFDTVQVNLTDHIDPDNVNDIVVRVAEGKAALSVNGKTCFEAKVKKELEPTAISLFVAKGKRLLLRDVRIRDLAPDQGAQDSPPPPKPPPRPEPKPDPKAAGVQWIPKGGFAEAEGGWEVADAPEGGASLTCTGSAPNYEVRFRVGKGADGLSVVPRANRGVERSGGIRLAESLFEKEEWTEVVLRMSLVTARVLVGGAEVGSLDVDEATGNPGIRVHAGGRAKIRDLSITVPKK